MMCTKQQHSSWLLTSYKKEKSEREEGRGRTRRRKGKKGVGAERKGEEKQGGEGNIC